MRSFPTPAATGKNNMSVFKHLGRESVIAQQITKVIPMNKLVQSERNQVVEEIIIKELDVTQESIGNGKGDESMSPDEANQHDSTEKESGSYGDYNRSDITDKIVEEVAVIDEVVEAVKFEQQESQNEKLKQVGRGNPVHHSYQNIEFVETAGTKMEESGINLIANSESKGTDEFYSLQNPLQHSSKDSHSPFVFNHFVEDKYSTESIKKLEDNGSQRINLPFEHAQSVSANVKLNPTFAIRTLPLSEVPSELHPFLKDYVPVRGEFVSIPGTNMTAVVPHGYASHYCFSRSNYSSVDKHLGPRQINDSISGNLYSAKNQIRPNWPSQPSSQATNASQILHPTHPVLKLNSSGINSITITPLEPVVIDSRITQPRRIVPNVPKTRNRLKSGWGGRIRGSRPRNYSQALKKPLNILPTAKSYYDSVDQVLTMPSEICPKLTSAESKESQCKNDISVPIGLSSKQNIERKTCFAYGTEQTTSDWNRTQVGLKFDNDKRAAILETKHGGRTEEDMLNSIEKGPTSLIDEEVIMGLAEVSKTRNKPLLDCQSIQKKPLFECMVCSKKYNREDFFSKHIKKCMKLHGVEGGSCKQSVGIMSSSSETSPPQKLREIETSSDDSRQNFDSICGSKNRDEHSLFHKNTNKKKTVSKSLHRSNRISSESEPENSFRPSEFSSALGRLDTMPMEILTPDLTSSELEEQSPQTKIQVQVLEQISTEEMRSNASGNSDPWLEEIMEIAEQEGIFIPSMEPVNVDQQLMDAVSSIL